MLGEVDSLCGEVTNALQGRTAFHNPEMLKTEEVHGLLNGLSWYRCCMQGAVYIHENIGVNDWKLHANILSTQKRTKLDLNQQAEKYVDEWKIYNQ